MRMMTVRMIMVAVRMMTVARALQGTFTMTMSLSCTRRTVCQNKSGVTVRKIVRLRKKTQCPEGGGGHKAV